MAEATIRSVEHRDAIVHPSAVVSSLAVVGAPGEWRSRASRFPAVIDEGVTIREFARVHAGCERPTHIGARTLVCSGAYVGHDVRLGDDCELAPDAKVLGCCTIGDRVRIGAGAIILPHVNVGADSRIGAGAVVTRDVPAGETWAGMPAKRLHKWEAAS